MRILVLFNGGGAADAYLVEAGQKVPAGAYVVEFTLAPPVFGHAAGCICCTPRSAAAAALAAMFRARATGTAPLFNRVVVQASAAGAAAVAHAIAQDLVVSARYRTE